MSRHVDEPALAPFDSTKFVEVIGLFLFYILCNIHVARSRERTSSEIVLRNVFIFGRIVSHDKICRSYGTLTILYIV